VTFAIRLLASFAFHTYKKQAAHKSSLKAIKNFKIDSKLDREFEFVYR
jgi:hypothetical protein